MLKTIYLEYDIHAIQWTIIVYPLFYWIVEKVIGIVPMKLSLTILEEYQCMILDKTLHSQ